MNKLPLVLAFLVITPPIVAQSKVLVARDRVSIPAADAYSGRIAYPTACDEQGRSYIKLVKSGPGMDGPLFRISSKGAVEAQFDTSGALINRYAVRPDAGVIMMHSDGAIKVLDNFAPDGTRESSVRLERRPVPFFPSQLAVFQSGEILISGLQYRPA
jgi:hypothetical protein